MAKAESIKHKDLLIVEASLRYLSAAQTEAWYQIGKNLRKIKAPLEAFRESHKDIVEKYGEKDKKTGETKMIGEGETAEVDFGKNKEKADALWKELIEEEVKVDFYKFPYEKFGDTAKLDAGAVEPLLDIIITD